MVEREERGFARVCNPNLPDASFLRKRISSRFRRLSHHPVVLAVNPLACGYSDVCDEVGNDVRCVIGYLNGKPFEIVDGGNRIKTVNQHVPGLGMLFELKNRHWRLNHGGQNFLQSLRNNLPKLF